MPVAAPADKRFRRAHVTPARRRRWRLAFSWPMVAKAAAVAAVVIFVLYKTVTLALSAEALTISTLTVTGNSRVSKGEVIAVLGGLTGQNMVTVDLESFRQELLKSPWVADAAMKRVLPGTIVIAISERRPLAIGRSGGDLYLLGQRGEIVDNYGPNYADLDLPIIDGLAPSRARDGLIAPARVTLAVRLLSDLQARPDLAARVSQVDVSDVHNAVVLLKNDMAQVRIGQEEFVDRLQSYVELAPTLRERVPDIDYVDLRFGDHLFVKPHGSAQIVRTASREKGD